MTLDLDLQFSRDFDGIPAAEAIEHWVHTAIQTQDADASIKDEAELTIRIVDNAEIAELNQQYRHKSGPTNVLSFPCDLPEGVELPLLGDIIISAPKVAQEAAEQQKSPTAHWAHMVIHGTLHLIGYDHIQAEEAHTMESLETRILHQLGFPDPYQVVAESAAANPLEPPSSPTNSFY